MRSDMSKDKERQYLLLLLRLVTTIVIIIVVIRMHATRDQVLARCVQ